MKTRNASPNPAPNVTIRVSGKLFQGHLAYLEQLVQSAVDCHLWPLLSLSHLQELDRPALLHLVDGENSRFEILSCPGFIREWIQREKDQAAA